jgi:hypothetical protein
MLKVTACTGYGSALVRLLWFVVMLCHVYVYTGIIIIIIIIIATIISHYNRTCVYKDILWK